MTTRRTFLRRTFLRHSLAGTIGLLSAGTLIDLARARPGQLNFSTAAPGTMNHLAGELLKSMAKINIVRVSYRGSPSALTAVLSGEVQMMFATVAPARPHIQSNKVRALAVTSANRSAAFPELPTIAESGVKGYALENSWGVFARKGVAADIVAKLNAEIVRVHNQQDVKDRYATFGLEAMSSTPARFAEVIRTDAAKYSKIIQATGAKVE